MLRRGLGRLKRRLRRIGPAPAAALAGLAAAVAAVVLAPSRPAALAVAAVVAVLELGLLAALLLRLEDAVKEAAVAPAQAAPVTAPQPVRAGKLPARKLRPLRRWTARLTRGFSATALPVMYGYADNEQGTYPFRIAMLDAIVEWRKGLRERRDEPFQGHLDIVLVSNLNLLGGTTASNVEEVRAYLRAGLSVGLLHHPVFEWNVGRDVNPKVAELAAEGAVMLRPGDDVTCDLMIVRFPPSLAKPLDDRPEIKPARTVLLINQTPFESYGPDGGRHFSWDVATVRDNLAAWAGPSTWYAIGPSVRETLERHHADELAGIEFAEDYWFGSLDPDLWRREGPREPDGTIRIGRHSRDHPLKWQTIAEDLRAAHPDGEDFEVHVLGGAESPRRVLGELPANWTEYPFGSVPAIEFLHSLDVAVYFTAEEYVEAFGRSPMEAMAAGLPCVMPPRFRPLFGDGGLYCEPHEVEDVVRGLMADPERYRAQSERSLAVVREHFSHEALLRRVAALGVRVPGARPGPGGPAGTADESGAR
ncbi:glycosyltransferase family protein [Glycomyces terrestris]|uniref:Glycosyltransferase family 1 protein n=1 Tax=Glycomyces terrestris TaxID=2493553 RepID=A0A426USG1_9ACTN|nr:glycosyltransferase [Glycomyces terrestris]RRR96458.1 glycosyltransferase family 1 protein [Glycomyces terrestris]